MNTRRLQHLLFLLLFAAGTSSTLAQDRTVGLKVNEPGSFEGYTLLPPLFHPSTYLIDHNGMLVHTWEHEVWPGAATYLLPDGTLLRADASVNPSINFGGLGGRTRIYSWEGDLIWEFEYSNDQYALHHDVEPLPNGNILMIAWEYRSVEEAIAAGRDPELIQSDAFWPEQVIEVQPTGPNEGEIVWRWHAWDHLIQDFDPAKDNYGVVEDHPELIDLNYPGGTNGDWLHANSIDYNAELDQIILSIPNFNEVWVIDHSTTTEEAAGHTEGLSGKGGDLLYRWGNPIAYRAGTQEDQQLFFQHDAQWVEPGLPGEGNILIFDNGQPTRTSAIVELIPPVDENGVYEREPHGSFAFGEVAWRYEKPGEFFSVFASGEQRLPNGNTLVAEAMTGRIFEVTPAGELVWEYVNPVTEDGVLARTDVIPQGPTSNPDILSNSIFRAYRYAPDYPGLQGRNLAPMGPLELSPTAIEPDEVVPAAFSDLWNAPNPFTHATEISFTVYDVRHVTLSVHNVLGQRVATLADQRFTPGQHRVRFDAEGLPSGIYFYHLASAGTHLTQSMVLRK